MSSVHGTVWWNELMTRDIDASRAYYEAVCGWSFDTAEMPEGQYHMAVIDGRPIAGMMDMSGMEQLEGVPPHWFTYLAVDDLDAALETATAKGGSVTRPPFEVPEVGWIAIVQDAGGAALGLMKPAPQYLPSESGEAPVDAG